jgi:hypothetical protein
MAGRRRPGGIGPCGGSSRVPASGRSATVGPGAPASSGVAYFRPSLSHAAWSFAVQISWIV